MSNNTETNIVSPSMNMFDQQAALQQRAASMIANEFETRQFPKEMLGEKFEELKEAVLKFATPMSMQITLEKFRAVKKRLREKTKHHAHTYAEVGGVVNSFENSANEMNMGSEDRWNYFCEIVIPLADKVLQGLDEIHQGVRDKLTSGMVGQDGMPLTGTKTGQA